MFWIIRRLQPLYPSLDILKNFLAFWGRVFTVLLTYKVIFYCILLSTRVYKVLRYMRLPSWVDSLNLKKRLVKTSSNLSLVSIFRPILMLHPSFPN